jgi:hypothetical protein
LRREFGVFPRQKGKIFPKWALPPIACFHAS